ncbi:MAG TPA: hypothetical protein VG939_20595, partial [Caulobacteraceae bacterium]|nr:hypothetical protein [Caulobacteraceae bacterium]
NHAVCTPGYVTDLLSRPEDAFPFHPDLTLTITAEAVSPNMLREIRRRICPRVAINLSSTEVGGWARGFVASDDDLFWYHLDPRRQVEVVDDEDRPLPPGELGRVRVRVAPGAEYGYFRDPELTARMFQGDWFYPGDLGELDGQGRIALHGRHTDVVSIQGAKHPVGPWERAIQDKLGCEGACIISGRLGERVEQLHLFLESRREISAAELREAVQSVLWGFENVAVHKLDALPRTPLGKVHRYELTRRLHEGEFAGV